MSTTEQESSELLLWIVSKGLGKAYEMAIRKLPEEKVDICLNCVTFMSCWDWGRPKVLLEPLCSVTFQKKDYIYTCSPKKGKRDQQQKSSEGE